jgi:hypothetical protein
MLQNCFLHLYIPQFQKCGLSDLQIQIFNKKITSISACGEGVLRLSKSEAITDMMASIVTPDVNRTFALYANECIFQFWPSGAKY